MPEKEPARVRTTIADFPGLINNSDPMDLPTGAAVVQRNATSEVPGRLTVRKGFQKVNFEN